MDLLEGRLYLLDDIPQGTRWQAGEEPKGKYRSPGMRGRVQKTAFPDLLLPFTMAASILLFYTLGSNLRLCLTSEVSMLMANKSL